MKRTLASWACLKPVPSWCQKNSVSKCIWWGFCRLICLQHTLECYTCSLDFQASFKRSQHKRFVLMNYCTCNEKRITIHAWDAHMLDVCMASGLLTQHLTAHPVNNAIKIFVKGKLTSLGMRRVGDGCNLFLELQMVRKRIGRCSQNTVTRYSC